MSLKEAYSLAHSAQCRLNIEASRPDRNLRFVVGHLMHYESLRLRIVEIEHDISRDQRAKAVQFQERMSAGQQKGSEGESRLRSQPSTGDLRNQRPLRKSSPPPPSSAALDDDDDDLPDDLLADDEDEEEGLGLQRFPSGSARPPQPPPDLEPDDDEDEDEDDYDPPSPEEPSEAALHFAMRNQPNEQLAKSYSQVRGCPCHRSQAPAIDRLWELRDEKTVVEGRTRAVVEVAEGS
ncbi:hypothetical protein D0869_01324 [Hortaea werneckii]|uniref:Uncharacterized protein n=1 Tax=Hortaea werneckii TaxID=91943 RepID=A0A3M6XDE4_HORWE|nr:hypothetical protein KC324_g1294 [Hortaea werneckii]KAI7594486.1 hypothetical protein KC316_g1090 [Hortaea werneckii]RMX88833.1 hypothetical protein D0869_01324 [Hortaea werneckii]RMY14517.1 hypothetical protein D0868_01401 [Hortaea werneckii]